MLGITGRRLYSAAGSAVCARLFSNKKARGAAVDMSTVASSEGILYTRGQFAAPFLGPVEAKQLPGPSGQMPDVDDLLQRIRQTDLSAEQQRWLSQMYDGGDVSTRPPPQLPQSQHVVPSSSLQQQQQQQHQESAYSSDSSSSNSTTYSGDNINNKTMDLSVLERVVAYNAFGDGFEDLAAASCRGADAQSHIGLWPHFNLLNHSCLPNVVHYVVDTLLLVRACHPVIAGEELLTSYLGRQEFAPASLRQDILKESCKRCSLETQKLSKSSQLALLAVHSDVQERLSPEFMQAAMSDDEETLQRIGAELQAQADRLLPVLQEVLSSSSSGDDCVATAATGKVWDVAATVEAPDAAALQVQAAVYSLLELLYMHAGIMGQDSKEELQLCTCIVMAVSPGSELHCFQTAKLLADAVQEHQASDTGGPPSPALVEAAAACQEAHQARYGQLAGSKVLVQLMQRNIEWSKSFL